MAAGDAREEAAAAHARAAGHHAEAEAARRCLIKARKGAGEAAAACREHGARVVYLTPTLQNPTNIVMSEERRRALARMAERHDLLIIEDDVYGYLIEDRPPTLATLAPEHTVHVTSVSKVLAPGLRVGWTAAPAAHVARLAEAQRVTAVCPPALTGEVVRLWIEDGSADAHIQWLRAETRARYEMALEYLADWSLRGHPASFHLLLELPPAWPSDTFASAARERGVGVLPASAFATEPGNGAGTVRLSLSQPPSRAALARGLGILRELLGMLPAQRPAII